MKRIFLAAFTIAVIILAGCEKKELDSQFLNNEIISATLTDELPQTRTTLNGLQVVWNENDQISVFAENSEGNTNNCATIASGIGTTSATFTVTIEGTSKVAAVYPYYDGNSFNGGIISMNMPSEYAYVENGIGGAPMAALISDQSASIAFKNAGALMGLTVNNIPAGYNKAILTSATEAITGPCEITFDGEGRPTMAATGAATGKVITINFDAVSTTSNKTFYFPIPIDNYSSLELAISNGSDTKVLKTKGLNAERSMRYKSTLTLDVITGEIPEEAVGAAAATEALEDNNSVNVTITATEENPTISLPANTNSTSLSFESIPEGKTVTIQETANADVSDEVHITASSAEESSNNFDINLPNSTVTLGANGESATYDEVTAWTATSTLIINENVTVTTLKIKGGNVRVSGTILAISRVDGNGDAVTYIICEEGAIVPENLGENMKVVSAATYDFLTFVQDENAAGTYTLTGNVTIPANTVIPEGVTIDGAGFEVTTDCTVTDGVGKGVFQLAGGTIKNIEFVSPNTQYDIIVTASGASVEECNFSTPTAEAMAKGKRAIFTGTTALEGTLSVKNCYFDDKVYAFNFSNAANKMDITFEDCTLGGWLSGHGKSHTFIDCAFTESGDYANYIPYCDALFSGCEFVDGFNISLAAAANNNAEIVFDDNSTYGENTIVDPADVQWDLSGDSDGCEGKSVTVRIGETDHTVTICATDDDEIKYLHGPYENNTYYLVPEVTVSGTNEIAKMREALSNGAYIKLVDSNIQADPVDGACFFHSNKSIIDGKDGRYLWNNDGSTALINTSGGILKNLQIYQTNKAIFIPYATSKVILESVEVSSSWSVNYAIHCDSGNGRGLEATNCKFYSYISYAAALGDVKFTGCTFGANEKTRTKGINAYASTEFVDCAFEEGCTVNLNGDATVTFENCTYKGEVITAANLADVVTGNTQNASVK